MRVNSYEFPKSSFLGMPKDCALLMDKILSNQTLLKLLYYNGRDWKNKPDLTSEQIKDMLSSDPEKRQISLVPRLYIHPEIHTYLHISYGKFIPNATNPHYRDNTFYIDIYCHYEDWDLGNYELKPYRIAGEIDAMLDGKHLTGIGELQFIEAGPAIYNEDFAGVSLTYYAIRGDEDKKNPLND